MKKVTIQEYAFQNGVSEKTVRRYIDAGKLPALKEMVNNRETTLVLIEDTEERNLNIVHNDDRHQVRQDDRQLEQNNLLQRDMTDNTKLIEKLVDKIENLAELAGQAKLLTDSERRTQEQYFELVQDKANLQAKTDLLEKQVEKLKKDAQENTQIKAELKLLQEKLKEQESNKPNWFKKL